MRLTLSRASFVLRGILLAPFFVQFGSILSFAQESEAPTKPTPDKTSDRLEAIEGVLGKIVQELQSIKQPKAPEVKPPTVKPPEPAAKAAEKTPSKPVVFPPAMKIDPELVKNVKWRSIGPANMAGRITDIAVHDKDPSLWFIATASGGILKTVNQGTTVTHQFDKQDTVSIGAIAVDPNDINVLWTGTGEINPRNSVSYGDGVYKSTDSGATWKNMGLKKSYQISRILVSPKDSKTVYVGVAGRLYGPNEERGVFKTTDGGETWEKVLFVDNKTGVIDMIMDPTNPDTIIAAFWDRQRDGFDSWPGTVAKPDGIDGYDPIRKWGPGSGLYKTTDAGKTWRKLTKGLPSSNMGRIGLDWQTKSSHAIYAIVDCEDIGKGPAPFAAFLGLVGANRDGKAFVTRVMPKSPAEKSAYKIGDQLVSIGEIEINDFDQTLDILRAKKVGEKIAIQIKRGEETLTMESVLTARPGAAQGQGQAVGVWLGVTAEDKEGKIVVTRVTADGPSEKAGLKEADIITMYEGKAPGAYQDMVSQVRTRASGDKVKLQVTRGTESMELTVSLEIRPAGGGLGSPTGPTSTGASNVYLGIQGESSDQGGAILTEITADGPAQKAGLEPSDIVKSMAGKPIANYEALIATIRDSKPGEKVKVTVLRGAESKELEVTFTTREGGQADKRPNTYSYFGQTPNIQDIQGAKGYEYGGIYRSDDGGENWERVNSLNTRPMYFSVVKVDPNDAKRVYVLGVSQFKSEDGGVTFDGNFGRGVHSDCHDLWIDPNDGRHMVIGGDGGFYVSYDRGINWDHINTAAVGQFYHVAISPKQPYWVVGGLQDNGSWGGPAISKNGGTLNEDWLSIGSGDGFVCQVDQQDPDLIYSESQNGTISRRHLKTGERASIRPQRSAVSGSYRFNWNTPFILSHQNSKIFYTVGNHVFRSLDRGNNLIPISPEITLTQRGSGTAISESPRNANVLYAGTDDGALWVTKNGGFEWKNITANLGIPSPRWVATIEASRFNDGRVFVALDGHRSDDDEPYLFESNDFGDTWRSIRSNLPTGSSRCLREDIANENMLYAGTEFALWLSMDRGANWTKLNTNLPTVAIHEVAQHPTNGEIVAATHGRSLWACDVSGLRQLKLENLSTQITLFKPEEVVRWRSEPSRGNTNRRYAGENPKSGAQIWYALPTKAERVSLRIEDIEGKVLRELRGETAAGLHRLNWDLGQQVAAAPRAGGQAGGGQAGSGPGASVAAASGPGAGGPAAPGGGRGPGRGRRQAENTASPDAAANAQTPTTTPPTTTPPTTTPPTTTPPTTTPSTTPPQPTDPQATVPATDPAKPPQLEEPFSNPEAANPEAAKPAANPVIAAEAGAESARLLEGTKSPGGPGAEGNRGGGPAGGPGARVPGAGVGAGFPGGGAGGRGGQRPAPNGSYRVVLIVDGKEFPPQSISLLRDPMAPEDAISEEEAEQFLLDEKRAADAKRAAKSEGRQLYKDN